MPWTMLYLKKWRSLRRFMQVGYGSAGLGLTTWRNAWWTNMHANLDRNTWRFSSREVSWCPFWWQLCSNRYPMVHEFAISHWSTNRTSDLDNCSWCGVPLDTRSRTVSVHHGPRRERADGTGALGPGGCQCFRWRVGGVAARECMFVFYPREL